MNADARNGKALNQGSKIQKSDNQRGESQKQPGPKRQRSWKRYLTPKQQKAVEKLRLALADKLGGSLVRLVLFGSRARGDHGRGSDIDIAAIVRGLTPELKHQILTCAAEIEIDFLVPLSLLVLDEAQFHFLLARERRLALDIENEGISIC